MNTDIEECVSRSMSHKQVIVSAWMSERLLSHAINGPYRREAENFNEDTFRQDSSDGAVPFTTLQYFAESRGSDIHSLYLCEAERVLAEAGHDPATGKLSDGPAQEAGVQRKRGRLPKEVTQKVEAYNEGKDEKCRIKDTGLIRAVVSDAEVAPSTVHVFFDGVLVHRQKEHRPLEPEAGKGAGKKWVEITNTAIGYGGQMARFPASSQEQAGKLASAVLVANKLDGKLLDFFSDGAQSIRRNVVDVFGGRVHNHFLDPLHIQKKIEERISLGYRGKKEEKQKIRSHLFSIIWAGNVDDFIETVRNMPKEKVRNEGQLNSLAEYVEKRRDYIPCYALRAIYGLKNSSNEAELTNRLLVTERGKNSVMSWSDDGSLALAAIAACKRAGQLKSYCGKRTITLSAFGEAA